MARFSGSTTSANVSVLLKLFSNMRALRDSPSNISLKCSSPTNGLSPPNPSTGPPTRRGL